MEMYEAGIYRCSNSTLTGTTSGAEDVFILRGIALIHFFASKKVNLPMLTVHKIILVGLLRC